MGEKARLAEVLTMPDKRMRVKKALAYVFADGHEADAEGMSRPRSRPHGPVVRNGGRSRVPGALSAPAAGTRQSAALDAGVLVQINQIRAAHGSPRSSSTQA